MPPLWQKCEKVKKNRLQKGAIFLHLEDVEASYRLVCEEYDAEPVGRVMIHALVRQLKAAGEITFNEKFEPGLNGVKAEVLDFL